MTYEVAEDQKWPGEWRVEAINESGDIFVALFAGLDAELRAREYAALKTTPPQQETKWIPVGEPAPDDFVLVLGKHELHGVNDPVYYRCGARSCGNGEFRDGFGNVLTRVIGWAPMPPLPTPPEEEKA